MREIDRGNEGVFPTFSGTLRVEDKVTGSTFESEFKISADDLLENIPIPQVEGDQILPVQIRTGRYDTAVIIETHDGRSVMHPLGKRVSKETGEEYYSLKGFPYDFSVQRAGKTDFRVTIQSPKLSQP